VIVATRKNTLTSAALPRQTLSAEFLLNVILRPRMRGTEHPCAYIPYPMPGRQQRTLRLQEPWRPTSKKGATAFPPAAQADLAAVAAPCRMLNPQMKDWGFYEATRRKAEQLRAEQRDKSEPTKPVWAPGSLEWQAEQNKSS
jgi:hypothetical protein